MKKLELHWQILIAIGLAIVAGLWSGTTGGIGSFTFVTAYDYIGTLFLNGLLMVVVPLVFSSIVVGIAKAGGGSDIGRLGLKTMGCYALFTTSAILVGLLFVNIMKPGYIDGAPAGEQLTLPLSAAQEATLDTIGNRSGADVFGIFLRMIPTNVFAAASVNDVLPLIFFGVLFGFFMGKLPGERAGVMLNFWEGVNDTMMLITMWVMKWAPLGVFGMIAETMAITGFEALETMLLFFVTVALALMTHIFLTLSLYLRVLGKASPLKHLRAMSPALLMAFSSASSNASLPLNIECLHKRAGVSERVTNFVLPLGATLNMDGTALYECVAAMFLAQAYGVELTFATQFTVVLLALLTSVGMAGIPQASLVAITVILAAIGLPVEALGLLFVTDRILDMLRTSVNVYSDSCGGVIIARSEGEKNLLV
jgi:proton glutamate symport protein